MAMSADELYRKGAKHLHPDAPTGDAERFRTFSDVYEIVKAGEGG